MRNRKARPRVPEFRSDEEMARWFETHDTADVWHEFEEVTPLSLPVEERRRILREARTRKLVTLRLDPDQIASARAIAARKGIPYLTQLRLWIREGMRRERVETRRRASG